MVLFSSDIIDVGTILDPASMQAYLADLFPDSAATLTSQWRRYQLEYTWRTTCQETYEPFETITKKALRHALAECGEDATERNIFDIMCQYETLEMYTPLNTSCDDRFPDVEKTLKKLTAQDKLELYVFSNGSHVNIQNARSTHHILSIVFPKDKVVSVDDVRAYKPSRTAYNHLLKSVDKLSRPQDVVLISSNPFDICGARSMGMRSLWINRTIAGWVDAMGEGPTWTFKSFAELANFDPKHVD
jgi:2-haloacid dehalogenase